MTSSMIKDVNKYIQMHFRFFEPTVVLRGKLHDNPEFHRVGNVSWTKLKTQLKRFAQDRNWLLTFEHKS